jgi:ArsR family transcriptional regulator
MKEMAKIFKALSDETRVHMLALLLANEELCVCDFMSLLNITQSKASRHLRYMHHAGLLDDRREAVWVHYKISKNLSKKEKVLLGALEKVFSDQEFKKIKAQCQQYLKNKAAKKVISSVA